MFLVSLVVCAFLCKPTICTHPPEVVQAYHYMKQLVEEPSDPKGIPFRKNIPGPTSLTDKIAIVGGGPTGLHMAYLLQKKGFQNVVVLERMRRYGGRVYSVPRRGAIQEMAACYTSPDFQCVIDLAEELGMRKPIDIPSATIWVNEVQGPLTFAQYIFIQALSSGKANSTSSVITALINATTKYIKIHRDLFGKYEGELMPRPRRSTLRNKLNKDFLTFIQDHDLEILKPIFLATQTMQGFGQLDEISAIYGLMWNTPNLMLRMVARSLKLNGGAIGVFPDGFETIWKRLVAQKNIDVRLSVNIDRICRYNRRGVFIYYANGTKERFDWLIWTARADKLVNLLPRPTKKERKFFMSLRKEWLTTTLFDSTYGRRGTTPIDYWFSSLLNKEEHGLWAQRDSYGVLNELNGKDYADGKDAGGSDGLKIRTGVAYQHGTNFPSLSKLRTDLVNHFENLGAKNVTIIKQIPWPYFPRYSIPNMTNGILWDIFNLQGIRRTWYSGVSVSFETVKSVMEYNKMLVDRLKVPEK